MFVSTKRVPFFNFFTFFGVPIIDSICFSMMNGDSEVIGLSSLLEIPKNFAKFSFALFVCVEVLRPSQPNGVMSSVVSLPNHTFTGQA